MTQLSNIFIVLISCHLLFQQVTADFSQIKIEPRVIGGKDLSIKSIPFLVQVRIANILCGGTRVSRYHIVTAAHCVNNGSPENVTIVSGATRLSDPGVKNKVSKIMIHPNYNTITLDMDIAVLRLTKKLPGAIPTPCNPYYPPKAGDTVQLFGWGSTVPGSRLASNELKTAETKFVDHAQCHDMYKNSFINNVVTENMFCASSPGVDACSGDSGSPVFVNRQFCGIVSWGPKCADPRYPGVYTDLSNMNVIKFLEDSLKK